MQQSKSLGSPEDEAAAADVMSMLSAELQSVAQAKTAATDIQISQTQGVSLPQRVAGSINAAYANLVSGDEVVVGRAPAGAKVIAQRGLRTVTDPETSELVFLAPRPATHAALNAAPVIDKNVVEAAYHRKNPTSQFDIRDAMKTLSSLEGNEMIEAMGVLRANLNSATAREYELIRQQAMQTSGYIEAQTAYDINVAADRRAGYNIPTHETNLAQAALTNAQARAAALEASLVASNPRIAEITAAKEHLKTTEEWRVRHGIVEKEQQAQERRQNLERQERDLRRAEESGREAVLRHERKVAWEQEKMDYNTIERRGRDAEEHYRKIERLGLGADRADARLGLAASARAQAQADKAAFLRSSVPEQQLTNYRIVYGTSGNDMKDRENIVLHRHRDKKLGEVVGANDTTIYGMLGSDDSSIREAGVKLVDGYDKLLNAQNTLTANDTKNTPEGEMAQVVRKVLRDAATPSILLKQLKEAKVYNEDEAKTRQQMLSGFGADAKAQERIRQQLIRDAVNLNVAQSMQDRYTKDVRLWRTSETANGPLRDAIQMVRTKDGTVPLGEFINMVITADLKDESGAVMTDDQKKGLLNRALTTAVQNGYRSSLFPKEAADALRDKIQAQINSQITYGFIGRMFSGSELSMLGRYYRDYRAGVPVGEPFQRGASGSFEGGAATGDWSPTQFGSPSRVGKSVVVSLPEMQTEAEAEAGYLASPSRRYAQEFFKGKKE